MISKRRQKLTVTQKIAQDFVWGVGPSDWWGGLYKEDGLFQLWHEHF